MSQTKESTRTQPNVEPCTEDSDRKPPRFEDVTRRISALSGGEVGEGRYYNTALRELSEFFSSPYVAMEVSGSTQNAHIEIGGDGKNGEFWKDILQDFMGETLAGSARARFKLLEAEGRPIKAAMLAAPLWDGAGNKVGCVVCATEVQNKLDARFRLSQLERLAIFLALFSKSQGSEQATTKDEASGAGADALARVSGYCSQTELAFAITNGIRGRTDCDLVALALVNGHAVKMLSISGADDVKKKSPGVKAMLAAFEESLDAKMPVVWPEGRDWLDQQESPRNHRLHAQWSVAAGGSHVASIPLMKDDQCVAILGMRRPGGEPFDPEQIANLQQTCSSYAPALNLVDRANRGLVRHAFCSASQELKNFITPRFWFSTSWKLAVLGLILWVAFGSVDYHVPAATVLQPGVKYHLAAPNDGALEASLVRAGDKVEKGQVLCRFDTKELAMEEARLAAEIAVVRLDERRFLAENKAVEAGLAIAKAKSLAASLAIARDKIEGATIRSPMDGVVLSGDLNARVGDAIQRGETLFEIAPTDGWVLEIKIDEKDIGLLGDDPHGEFSCHARPEEKRRIRIDRIRPMAEQSKNKNVFVAEALIDAPAFWMKTGMEGMATLDAGHRRVWWVASRRAIEWLKMNFWL